MATSGFYYTPRPIITVGPTRYFDVNEERPGAVNEQRLFGGTQRIQVDCADYDRRRANALRVHALLHFGGMIIDLPTALAFVLTLLCPPHSLRHVLPLRFAPQEAPPSAAATPAFPSATMENGTST